ncbi:ATP-binding protein [Mucilaginibacter aquaedulcis]|uniref:ATP-binding protein n=1 Tax=Mucilaginibacter aquaedulcis TaxID=1187081 RepID=UPI0025B3F931|nr:ATP-binding protein [Mucilaginibacter aquaedulcis]MDN3547820.1 ATP-binding protein [Mucilaginibacter aquaedulcis]
MMSFTVDLTNCDREPIHIPGQIQSHGFIVVIDQTEHITFFSENIGSFIPIETHELLGKPVTAIEPFLQNVHQNILKQLLQLGRLSGYEQINPYQVTISGQKFNLILSKSNDYEILEFEPDRSTVDTDVQKMIGRSVSEMLADKNLQNLLNNTANQVKNIIHYDRVMIYRFAEDGHGEVIAEAKNESLESWLGLHYPASDIPKQARELYKLNLTRLIADVHSLPSRILTSANNTSPLDLTWSQLRAVSPIHIQYLKNMGVASSFSISLMYKGELWGLVACHSYTPRFIDFKSRESAKLIGQILSSALEFRQDEENQLLAEAFKANLDHIAKYLQHNEYIDHALTNEKNTLLDLTNATGTALIYEKKITLLGITPNKDQVKELVDVIKKHIKEQFYITTCLSDILPEGAAYAEIASGVLVVELSKELEEYIIWFKPEHIQTINWAGNPNKPIEFDERGMTHISPRHSFEVWSQNVKGVSDSWRQEEIASATRLKEEINYAINLKAGALRLLNERLRIAYEELDSFSYTISHDLKNPISSIKSYGQIIQRAKAFGEREREMVGKIVDRADKMNFMINEVLEYSRIGRLEINFRPIKANSMIRDIVKDLEPLYPENMHVTFGEMPDLSGDPLMLMQAFANVIGNAVKYSQKASKSEVSIAGKVEEKTITYQISDNGLGIPEAEMPNIFNLFNRLSNVGDIEGTGVGLAIVKRIVEKHHGKVWAESEPGKGAIFYLSFKH